MACQVRASWQPAREADVCPSALPLLLHGSDRCSWFAKCDLGALQDLGTGHMTHAVRREKQGRARGEGVIRAGKASSSDLDAALTKIASLEAQVEALKAAVHS